MKRRLLLPWAVLFAIATPIAAQLIVDARAESRRQEAAEVPESPKVQGHRPTGFPERVESTERYMGPTDDVARFLSVAKLQLARAAAEENVPSPFEAREPPPAPRPGWRPPACTTDGDCKKGEACGFDPNDPTARRQCITGNCETDADCSGGLVCTLATRDGLGAIIFRCAEPGPQKMGESCSQLVPAQRCGAGLTCMSNNCYSKCDLSTACPDGSKCMPSKIGALCVPQCSKDADCGEGMTCIRNTSAGNICRKQIGPVCYGDLNCRPGSACVVAVGRAEVHSACARCCNPASATACHEGMVCGLNTATNGCASICVPECESNEDCGQKMACVPVNEDGSMLGCMPQAE